MPNFIEASFKRTCIYFRNFLVVIMAAYALLACNSNPSISLKIIPEFPSSTIKIINVIEAEFMNYANLAYNNTHFNNHLANSTQRHCSSAVLITNTTLALAKHTLD